MIRINERKKEQKYINYRSNERKVPKRYREWRPRECPNLNFFGASRMERASPSEEIRSRQLLILAEK